MRFHQMGCTNIWGWRSVKWSRRELQEMDLRSLKEQHMNARMYLLTSEGGRGLLGLEQVWEREIVSVAAYLLQNEDTQVQGAGTIQQTASNAHCSRQRKS